MRQGERMTEYLDELVCLQNEEVKHRLLTGLLSEVLGEIEGYLDLIHSQREAWRRPFL